MTLDAASVLGMPYFPGIAVGELRKGARWATSDSIVILSQSEIPSLTITPAGFIVVEGAPFSHGLIALLAYAVPSVLISEQQVNSLNESQRLQINGNTGEIFLGDLNRPEPEPLPKLSVGSPVMTADQVPINLCASVRHVNAAKKAVNLGAQAIGLVRTEFILPDDGCVPDRSYYDQAFLELCRAASPLNITFRLLDLCVDKVPSWIPDNALIGCLGLQGARLYGIAPVNRVIEAQILALKALSQKYSLRLLIPYLVSYEEMSYWVEHLRKQFDSTIPIGAMVETPASALDVAHWLDRVDFVAVGCNDLMQCFFAADRDQAELRHYLDPYAPGLYRLFQQMSLAAGDRLDRILLCGLLSQIQGVLPLLIGLGYRNFSVDSSFIPYLAQKVQHISVPEAESLVLQVCEARETRDVLELLNLSQRHVPYLTQ